MTVEKLTKEYLKRLTCTPDVQIIWEEGSNLGVAPGVRAHRWVVRLNIVQSDGTTRRKVGRIPGGKVSAMSPEKAREFLTRAEAAALEGQDLTDRPRRTRRTPEVETVPEPEGPATVSTLVHLYYERADIRPSTRRRYRSALVHIDREIGSVPVLDLRRAHLAQLKESMSKIKDSFNKARSLLCAAYNAAAEREWTHLGVVIVPDGFNPTRLVKKYSDKETGKKVGDPFSREEREAIAAAAAKYLNPEERARMKGPLPAIPPVATVMFLFYSGLRKNEAMGLSKFLPQGEPPEGWSGWIDRQHRVIRIERSKTGPRKAPLSSKAIEILDMLEPFSGEFWIFPGRFGRSRLASPRMTWRRLLKEAGVRYRNIHNTRHTFAVTALERGAPIAAVAKALGHTTVYMTETYAKISDRAAQEAAEAAGQS